MILVDSRDGSKDLILPLRKLGLEVDSTRLEFGDIAFEGRGARGRPLSIGVEFKKLEELVGALRATRLQGYQMRGMRGDTETAGMYDVSYLLIEGELLYDRQGSLLKQKRFSKVPMAGRMTAQELLKRIFVLHLCGGLNPIWTQNRADTLQHILALYRTWTDQDLDKHRSHLALYEAPALIPISDKRRTFKTLPGVGLRASAAVEATFGSLAKAAQASVDQWAEVLIPDDKGGHRRLGIKAAERVVEYLHNEE